MAKSDISGGDNLPNEPSKSPNNPEDAGSASHAGDVRDIVRVPKYVADKEAESIRERRKKAFKSGAEDSERAKNPDQLDEITDGVGIALSGGGIRSASFNLGLIQSLIRTGIVRWIDFMSTVSGGGFIGSYVSTALCHDDVKYDHKIPLIPSAASNDPKPVRRFIHGGKYLKAGPEMSDRFLIGFLWNGLLWLTLVMFITSLIAYAWRWLDDPQLALWLRDGCGYGTSNWFGKSCNWIGLYFRDWSRPFAPAILLTVVWLVIWVLVYIVASFRRGSGVEKFLVRMTWYNKYLPSLILLTVVIGLSVLLATDDISLKRLGHIENTRVNGHSIIARISVVIIVVSLLVTLNPLRLARSELRPPSKFEMAAGRITGSVLLFLGPFCLLYWFASEGISESSPTTENQRSALAAADLGNPLEFLAKCQREHHKAPQDTLGGMLYDPLETQFKNSDSKFGEEDVEIVQGIAVYFDGKSLDEDGELHELLVDKTWKDSILTPNGPFETLAAKDENFQGKFNSFKTKPSIESLIALGDGLGGDKDSYHLKRQAQLILSCHLARMLNRILIQGNSKIPYEFSRTRYNQAILQQGRTPEDESLAVADPLFNKASKLREADLFFDRLWPDALLTEGNLDAEDRQSFNRLVLEANFGDALVEQRTKLGVTLNWQEDQQRRLLWCLGSLGTFVLLGFLIDFNSTSLHGFYRKKIKETYTVENTKGAMLKNLETTKKGGPYHIICATINFFDDLPWRMTEFTSAYTFLFSRHFCGSQALTAPSEVVDERIAENKPSPKTASTDQGEKPLYAKTENYCKGQLSVPTAAAISGAAFSPATLRNPLYSITMLLLNFRLGQWLPNPSVPNGHKKSRRVMLLTILKDLYLTRVGTLGLFLRNDSWYRYEEAKKKEDENERAKKKEDKKDRRRINQFKWYKLKASHWNYCFITDGGHNDNLGISPLVFRRCRLMIFSDATRDEQYRFQDFLKIFRRYRMRGAMHFCRLDSWSDWLFEPTEGLERVLVDLSPLRASQADESSWLQVSKNNDTHTTSGNGRREQITKVQKAKSLPDRSNRHIVLSKLIYPEKGEYALVIYLKSTMTGDEPEDLLQYQIDNPQFPHDPTTDQFFTEDQVESYRQLGEHIGLELCQTILEGMRTRGHAVGAVDPDLNEVPLAWVSALNSLDTEELVRCLLTGYFGPLQFREIENTLEKDLSPATVERVFGELPPNEWTESLPFCLDQINNATKTKDGERILSCCVAITLAAQQLKSDRERIEKDNDLQDLLREILNSIEPITSEHSDFDDAVKDQAIIVKNELVEILPTEPTSSEEKPEPEESEGASEKEDQAMNSDDELSEHPPEKAVSTEDKPTSQESDGSNGKKVELRGILRKITALLEHITSESSALDDAIKRQAIDAKEKLSEILSGEPTSPEETTKPKVDDDSSEKDVELQELLSKIMDLLKHIAWESSALDDEVKDQTVSIMNDLSEVVFFEETTEPERSDSSSEKKVERQDLLPKIMALLEHIASRSSEFDDSVVYQATIARIKFLKSLPAESASIKKNPQPGKKIVEDQ